MYRRDRRSQRELPAHLRPRKALHVNAPTGVFETQQPPRGRGKSLNYSSIQGYDVLRNVYKDPKKEAAAAACEATQPRRGRKYFAEPRSNPLGVDLDAPIGSAPSSIAAPPTRSPSPPLRTGAPARSHGRLARGSPSPAPLMGSRSVSRSEQLNPYARASYKHKYADNAYNPVTNEYVSPAVEASAREREAARAARKTQAWVSNRTRKEERPHRKRVFQHGSGSRLPPGGGTILSPAPQRAIQARASRFDHTKKRWYAASPPPPAPHNTRSQSDGVSSSLSYGGPPPALGEQGTDAYFGRSATNPNRGASTVGSVLAYGSAAPGPAAPVRRARKTGPQRSDRGYNILAHPNHR